MTELGPQESVLRGFGLRECTIPGYVPRTLRNLREADGTVIFGDNSEPGSKKTTEQCALEGRRFLVNPDAAELAEWIVANRIEVLNVAGNRASVNPGVTEHTVRTLTDAIRSLA